MIDGYFIAAGVVPALAFGVHTVGGNRAYGILNPGEKGGPRENRPYAVWLVRLTGF